MKQCHELDCNKKLEVSETSSVTRCYKCRDKRKNDKHKDSARPIRRPGPRFDRQGNQKTNDRRDRVIKQRASRWSHLKE